MTGQGARPGTKATLQLCPGEHQKCPGEDLISLTGTVRCRDLCYSSTDQREMRLGADAQAEQQELKIWAEIWEQAEISQLGGVVGAPSSDRPAPSLQDVTSAFIPSAGMEAEPGLFLVSLSSLGST